MKPYWKRCFEIPFKTRMLVAFCVCLLSQPGVSAAGGLRVGVISPDPFLVKEDDRILALIANDLIPYSLERAFDKYGLAPFVIKMRKEDSSPRKELDVVINADLMRLGSDTFFVFRVADLRPQDRRLSSAEQTFTAIPASKSVRDVEVALRGTTEQIASAIVGKSAFRSDPVTAESPIEGLIFVWCILPDDVRNKPESLAAADLTITLPFALGKAADDQKNRARFVGLSQKDYFFECRDAASGSTPRESKQVEGTYTISGKIVLADNQDLWLRLFAEDRGLGQSLPLAPIKLTSGNIEDPTELLAKNRSEIARSVIANFTTALTRIIHQTA